MGNFNPLGALQTLDPTGIGTGVSNLKDVFSGDKNVGEGLLGILKGNDPTGIARGVQAIQDVSSGDKTLQQSLGGLLRDNAPGNFVNNDAGIRQSLGFEPRPFGFGPTEPIPGAELQQAPPRDESARLQQILREQALFNQGFR